MTHPDNTNLEQRLIAALQQEASLAMTMTDTQRELERLQHDLDRRRNRQRVIAAVAAAAAAVAVVLGIAFGVTGSDTRKDDPIKQPEVITPRSQALTAVDPVPGGTTVTKAKGPVNPGSVAFGAVWATGLEDTGDHIYRLDAATGEVLSTSSFTPIDNVVPVPVRVGDAVLVPAMNGKQSGYAAFDRRGEQAGFIAADNAGLIAGDATGGWIQRDLNTIARVDATGLQIERTVSLPDPDETGVLLRGLAVAGNALYVALQVPQAVYRLDAATGEVVDHVDIDVVPAGVVATTSALYLATEEYSLLRFDTALRVTATITGLPGEAGSFFLPIAGPGGSIWVAPNLGGIVELDATSLEPVRSFQILPNAQAGWDFGGAVTDKRLFVGYVNPEQIGSIPLS
jgi:hypothetical protein